ncbi:MAG: nucleoside monophosphate kinase [Clostridia bacterium]|nr:nucleoside monophosphate kinase [Clostridia bacterium]
MSTIVLVVGKNGAGKGTLLDKFMNGREEEYQILAMSGLLTKVRETDPELWAKIDAIMKSGELVPDDIILKIVSKELNSAAKTVICDGFPRNLAQAKAMINAGHVPAAVIEVYLEDEQVIQRAGLRRVCSKCRKSYTVAGGHNPPKQDGICDDCGSPLVKRPDDEEEVVRKRLNQYEQQTYPVIEFFENAGAITFEVDNSRDGSAAQIEFEEILDLF